MRLVSRGFKEDIQTNFGINSEEPEESEEKECKVEDESSSSQQTTTLFLNNGQFPLPRELTNHIASFLCPYLDQINKFTKDREIMEQSIEAAS